MNRPIFQVRHRDPPEFVQDQPTVIFEWKHYHQFSTATRSWIRRLERGRPVHTDYVYDRISFWRYLRLTGIRGIIEIIEDRFGLCFIGKTLDRIFYREPVNEHGEPLPYAPPIIHIEDPHDEPNDS